MKTTPTEHYHQQFTVVRSELPGLSTPWFDQLRKDALNRFSEKGFPQRKAEDWKYTNLSVLTDHNYVTKTDQIGKINDGEINSIAGEIDAEISLVLINGRFSKLLGNLTSENFRLENLATLVSREPETIREYLAESAETLTAFESLNTAFMADGVYLHVNRDAKISKPIQILHVTTSQDDHVHYNTRNLFIFGENSEVRIIERFLSLDSIPGYLNNTVSQVILKDGAKAEYIKLQDEDPQSFHLSVHRVHLNRDSRFSAHSFSLGGLLSRNDVRVDFLGENASCNLNGLFLVDGERQADNYTTTEHRVPRCQSSEQYKGILNDQGKGVFRGKIKVHQDAQKSDARLNNSNLLLSEKAEVDTMPQLEIYADDVKCSHGSGSGQLDTEQLFYLTSRGIDHAVAHALLVFGFASSVLERIESESLKGFFKNLLISRLSANREIKELVQ